MSDVPHGMAALEWHMRKMAKQAVDRQLARLDAIEADRADAKELRRRMKSQLGGADGSPLQPLIDAELAKRRKVDVPWWRFWG